MLKLIRAVTMTGDEVKMALRKLDHEDYARREELLHDYRENEYYPKIKAIKDQCPHESEGHWRRNGIGWSWKECRFCGTRMESAPTDEVGGELYGS